MSMGLHPKISSIPEVRWSALHPQPLRHYLFLPRCSCTVDGCISLGTCFFSGFLGTTSRIRWGISDFSLLLNRWGYCRSITGVCRPTVRDSNGRASGAIGCVMGGYLMLYPRVKVTIAVFIFIIFGPSVYLHI